MWIIWKLYVANTIVFNSNELTAGSKKAHWIQYCNDKMVFELLELIFGEDAYVNKYFAKNKN